MFVGCVAQFGMVESPMIVVLIWLVFICLLVKFTVFSERLHQVETFLSCA